MNVKIIRLNPTDPSKELPKRASEQIKAALVLGLALGASGW